MRKPSTQDSTCIHTYAVIPSLLGVSPDPEMGIVAGTASDCNGDAFEGAQIVVRSESGSIPDSEVVKYFVDDFPNRQQLWTSDDGLWVAINIPVGQWVIEMWVYDEVSKASSTRNNTCNVLADSINIANVVSGHNDGLLYPDNPSIVTEAIQNLLLNRVVKQSSRTKWRTKLVKVQVEKQVPRRRWRNSSNQVVKVQVEKKVEKKVQAENNRR